MGQEISESHFTEHHFRLFQDRLEQETELLAGLFRDHAFSAREDIGGFELEAWLVDRDCNAAPINEQYLARLDSPLVVPELARFNVELNSSPQLLRDDALRRMEQELDHTWNDCREVAGTMDAELMMIGILPTVRNRELTLANMSSMTRYRALNEQVLRQREGRPLKIDIRGRENLVIEHPDVMLESAATSFQIHLQVSQAQAVRYYNAAQIVSAPMVAACANSPFLFGRALWEETRIPLFEQAVEVGGLREAAFGPMRRVTFGTGYARESLFECFRENLEHYPALLPILLEDDPQRLSAVRLHNGTLWRWNRPLIGFDEDGRAHLRIEHRVVPSGPSVVDAIANAALFFGLARDLATEATPPESRIDFATARDNFYEAARLGLEACLNWDSESLTARSLLLDELLPRARRGLHALGVEPADIDRYIGVIETRVDSGMNGAAWQRAFAEAHGRDMPRLARAYLEHQRSGAPVHTWPV